MFCIVFEKLDIAKFCLPLQSDKGQSRYFYLLNVVIIYYIGLFAIKISC